MSISYRTDPTARVHNAQGADDVAVSTILVFSDNNIAKINNILGNRKRNVRT